MKAQFLLVGILIVLLVEIIAIDKILNVSVLSNTKQSFIKNNISSQISPSPIPTFAITSIPIITFTPTVAPSPSVQINPPIDSDTWVWETLGCGSNAPCVYRVCLSTESTNCYSCRGFYDKNNPEGEKLPSKNEDPLTTTSFNCRKF